MLGVVALTLTREAETGSLVYKVQDSQACYREDPVSKNETEKLIQDLSY